MGAVWPAGVVRESVGLSITSGWIGKSEVDVLGEGEFKLPAKEKGKDKDKDKGKKEKKHKKSRSKSSDDESTSSRKSGKQILKITFHFGANEDEHLRSDAVVKTLRSVEKMSKKKNWPNREWGCKVDVRIKSSRGGSGFAEEEDEA